MQLIYLRRSMILLAFWDAVIKPVGIIHPKVSPKDGETNMAGDSTPPQSQILVSVYDIEFCVPLAKCPDTDEKRHWRKLCFSTSCRDDEEYHCGTDEDRETIVEFCYSRYPCDKGYYGSPKTDADMVQLDCKICPKSHFNPVRRLSPTNMDQCSAHRHIPPEENTVLLTPGTNIEPAVYYCDAEAGYASRHHTLFCKPAYQRCDCEFQGDACRGEDLLPDKRCVPRCDGERPPSRNFSCVLRKDSEIDTYTSSNGLKRTTKGITPDSESTHVEPGKTLGILPDDKSRDNDGLKPLESFGIIVGSLSFILLIVVILCRGKHWFCFKWSKSSSVTVGGNYTAVKKAEHVNITIRGSKSSNSSETMSDNTATSEENDVRNNDLIN